MSDNNEKELKYISPFKYQLIQSFPFIAEDFDQITQYGLYCKLANKMNEVISNNNNLNDDMLLYIQKFNNLKAYVDNYFDNLDVQDEINNKLDELAENGTLTTLIGDYIDPLINAQNQRITSVENQVSSLASGAPTLVDSTSEMTDTTKIYLLSTDGNWYYYNGTNWISGGVYQATQYGENTIPNKSIKNVVYDKVNQNLNSKSLTTSSFTNLTGATIEEDSTTITIRRTSTSSNCQFRLNIPIEDLTLSQKIILTISNMRCIPFLNLPNSNNKTITNCILRNGETVIIIDPEDLQNTTQILFSLYANNYSGIGDGQIFLTISKTYSIANTIVKDNVNNLAEFINDYTSYNGIRNIQNYLQFNQSYGNVSGISEIIRSDNDFTFTITASNRGIRTIEYTETSKTLHIKGNVDSTSNSINLYVVAKESNNQEHFNYYPFTAGSSIDLKVDLSYLAVYQNMAKFYIIINGGSSGTYKVKNIEMYIDEISDLELYDETLGGTLRNIQNKFSQIESDVAQNRLIVTSPNGTKYKIKVDNSGNLSTSPISLVAQKGLFIGNSLLNGFGTHGMASYNTQDDYYYLVNQYLLTKNANYTSTKISGTDWESAINNNQTNNFITNILTPAMTSDTDIVFIQLGDNCNTTEKINFIPTKAPMLIDAILNINPNATIYWIASWYNNSTKQTYLTSVCNDYNIKYINIAPLSIPENQAYIGYEYVDSNNQVKTISSAGVASHPSSVGMQAIANKIIAEL